MTSRKNSEVIFSLPFWKKFSPKKIKKYTGYCKGYRNSSSLRSDRVYLKEEFKDRIIQEDYERKRDKYLKDQADLLDFVHGSIW